MASNTTRISNLFRSLIVGAAVGSKGLFGDMAKHQHGAAELPRPGDEPQLLRSSLCKTVHHNSVHILLAIVGETDAEALNPNCTGRMFDTYFASCMQVMVADNITEHTGLVFVMKYVPAVRIEIMIETGCANLSTNSGDQVLSQEAFQARSALTRKTTTRLSCTMTASARSASRLMSVLAPHQVR